MRLAAAGPGDRVGRLRETPAAASGPSASRVKEPAPPFELIAYRRNGPDILGLGIEDEAAIVVNGNTFEVIGTGRVAVYDNVRRNGLWYYWLRSGEWFELAGWTSASPR